MRDPFTRLRRRNGLGDVLKNHGTWLAGHNKAKAEQAAKDAAKPKGEAKRPA